MPVAVGADLKAVCGKCKGTTFHVVLAMVDSQIARVQCKSCGAQHRYRPPDGAQKRRATATAQKTTRAKKAAAAPPESPTPTVEPDLSKPIRGYSFRERFEAGERIDHSKFGIGVVESIDAPGKMTVWFPDGRRVLATAKPEASLARPANRTFET